MPPVIYLLAWQAYLAGALLMMFRFEMMFFFSRTFVEPALIAKSNIILDVKPWDDETDMAELEKCVRTIEMDGLLWGACK